MRITLCRTVLAVAFAGLWLGFTPGVAHGQVVLNENFATYSNGNLVGQNGWTQFGASSTVPVQVASGQVVIPAVAPTGTGGPVIDNQDVYKTFSTFTVPGSGTTSVFAGFTMTVSSSFANPSFFFAMSDAPGGFTNERVAARDNGAGAFQIGGRVTGQAGYPFVYGTALNYGTQYQVFVEADLVAGAQNDVIKIFVNPTSNNLGAQTAYITETYTTGTGTDPTSFSLAVLSQFANATTGEAGITFGQLVIAGDYASAYDAINPVPEPTSMALAGIGGLGVAWRAWRRKKAKATA